MKKLLLFIIFFIAFIPTASASILELDMNARTDLNSDWTFYKNELLTDANTALLGETVSLPHFWTRAIKGREGYGTYMKTILLKNEDVGKSFGIYIPYQATAYNLYINNELVIKQGSVSALRQDFTPLQKRVHVDYVPMQKELTFILQVSNFTYLPGGAEKPITFGTSDSIENMVNTENLFYTFIFGCYFILILNAIVQFLFYTKRRSFLWLGVFSLTLILWNLFSSNHVIMSIFPELPWDWLMRGEVTLAMFALATYYSFLKSSYPTLVSAKFTRIIQIYSIISAIIVLGIPVNGVIITYNVSAIMVLPAVVYVAYILIKAIVQKLPYSYFTLLANIVFFIAIVQDILAAQAFIESSKYTLIGFLSFLIFNTIMLSWDYTKQLKNSEYLNEQLSTLNTALDKKVQERTKELQIRNEQLERLSFVDGLTNCMNRRYFDLEMEKISSESDITVSLLLFDIDFFKKYNDYYGHLGGDEVLKTLSAKVQHVLPEQALLIRYGGEEFAIILKDFMAEDALSFAISLQQTVDQLQMPHLGRDDYQVVTISIGVAQKLADETIDQWIERTDQALYSAKASGRNQAQLYEKKQNTSAPSIK